MRVTANWWFAVGPPEHWQIAFQFGKIWGLRGVDVQFARWQKLLEGDRILFYATKPVSGVIGYGVVRTKFKQDKPLWFEKFEKEKSYGLTDLNLMLNTFFPKIGG